MGGDRGGKANGGYGKGGGWKHEREDGHKGSSRGRWPKEKRNGRNGWETSAGAWESQDYGQAPRRILAAQFRFFSRVLRRHAPEERVWAAEQQLQPGDHILVQWECSEQHGIVCSNSGGRRGHNESPWVIFWSGDRLQSQPLPKFIHGGELHRMVYPLWACRCSSNFSSTIMPDILAEDFLEAAAPEVTVRMANDAQRTWRPSWALSADLEFCLFAKLGGQTPMWEIHKRQAFSEKQGLPAGHPLGCLMRGKPSELLSGASAPSTSASTSASRRPERYPVQLAKEPWTPSLSMDQVPFAPFAQQVPNAMSMAPMAPMSAAAEAFIPSMWPMAHQMPVQPVHGMPVQPAVPIQSGGATNPPDETVYQ